MDKKCYTVDAFLSKRKQFIIFCGRSSFVSFLLPFLSSFLPFANVFFSRFFFLCTHPPTIPCRTCGPKIPYALASSLRFPNVAFASWQCSSQGLTLTLSRPFSSFLVLSKPEIHRVLPLISAPGDRQSQYRTTPPFLYCDI